MNCEAKESKAGLVPHGFVVGKKRKEKKREMERTRSRLVKMSGWNEVRRVDEMISNGSGLNIYDRRRENDKKWVMKGARTSNIRKE